MVTDSVSDRTEMADRLSERKKRLFICACARRSWKLLSGRAREGVKRGEMMADGKEYSKKTMNETRGAMWAAVDRSLQQYAHNDALLACEKEMYVNDVIRTPTPLTKAEQLFILLDLAGPGLTLPWLPAQAISLAQAAYDNRADTGELDPVRLAILADALEEAGVTAPVNCRTCRGVTVTCHTEGPDEPDDYRQCCDCLLLVHLRSPGPHYRGCWALDLVLGKS